MKSKIIFLVVILSIIMVYSMGSALATDYSFRGKTFEENSECAQYFIDYQTSEAYDIFTMAAALMKFDSGCNPIAP